MLKVGVWGPGSMGVIALRGVIDHPQLALVDAVQRLLAINTDH